MIKPAIVVVTYNRPDSLERILSSIYNANYEGYSNISLVISIDGGGPPEILQIAELFEWKYGKKRIITHEENIGLRKHIISCGDLTEEYDNVIVLEDDLFVSPYFYEYAVETTSFYKEEKKIAGISLTTYETNELAKLPFVPLQNGYDVFLMQVPCSWGQIWTQKQWQTFKLFYNANPIITEKDKLPKIVKKWPETSWKKYFYKYMVDNDLYFVYPYRSYTTNFCDAGTHMKTKSSNFQVSLMNTMKKNTFPQVIETKIIYDAYMELLPKCFWQMGIKPNVDFCVDIYGTKQIELFENEYWFSIKKSFYPIEQYGIDLIPIENNIILGILGKHITFSKRTNYRDIELNSEIYSEIAKTYNQVVYGKGYFDGLVSVKKTISYKWGYYSFHPVELIKVITRKLKNFIY